MSLEETFHWLFPNAAQAGGALFWVFFVFSISLALNNQSIPNKLLNMLKYGLITFGAAVWAVSLRLLYYEIHPYRSAALMLMVWVYTIAGDWLSYLVYHWLRDATDGAFRNLSDRMRISDEA